MNKQATENVMIIELCFQDFLWIFYGSLSFLPHAACYFTCTIVQCGQIYARIWIQITNAQHELAYYSHEFLKIFSNTYFIEILYKSLQFGERAMYKHPKLQNIPWLSIIQLYIQQLLKWTTFSNLTQ